jgi:hypothetical protein
MPLEGTRTLQESVGLAVLLERFPQHGTALQRLFQDSDAFRSLCGDYEDGLAALKRWQRSTSEEAPPMRSMYAVLLEELEQEVREYLKSETAAHCYP